ncbi:rhodanese-like domain-containing protein 17 isoform X2 [Raphanus sativus]|uniref:Rhodanese-like domain-containing protein 17 isoform X2 n=1 Tax=Raphanus sativus TaxID=3726 RepID=A0A6J0P7H1_RAPSA|nr:rhodanese-like domain-containing protein 17 isoform X2 [Raphanus sativus]
MVFSHFIRSVLFIFIVYHLSCPALSNSEPEDITIDVNQAHKLLHHGYTFLDVRTGEEFEKGHVDSEKVFNVPYWFYTPQGQENNPNFLKHVSSLFNQTDHLVVNHRLETNSKQRRKAGACEVCEVAEEMNFVLRNGRFTEQ